MIRQIASLSVDVVPQAILALPVREVIGRKPPTVGSRTFEISRDYDDLDFFEGASFRLDNQIEIAVRHYAGHAENTTTIYIDISVRDVERITSLIRKILRDLHIPENAIQWERRDDPNL